MPIESAQAGAQLSAAFRSWRRCLPGSNPSDRCRGLTICATSRLPTKHWPAAGRAQAVHSATRARRMPPSRRQKAPGAATAIPLPRATTRMPTPSFRALAGSPMSVKAARSQTGGAAPEGVETLQHPAETPDGDQLVESLITHTTSSALSAALLIVAVLALALALLQPPRTRLRPVCAAPRRGLPSAKR